MFRLLGLSTLLFAVALFAVPAPAADEKPDAEKLVKAMEEKLAKAKTVECEFEGSNNDKPPIEWKGTLFTSENNKLRIDMKGGTSDQPGILQASWHSNGDKLIVYAGNSPVGDIPAPKGLNPAVLNRILQMGVFAFIHSALTIERPGKLAVKIDNSFALSNFKLGNREKVGSTEAQVVEYTVSDKDEKQKLICRIWIDPKTQLPVKLAYSDTKGGKRDLTHTETFTKLILDGKIDPAKFELPK